MSNRFPQKPLGGILVAMGGEEEIDGQSRLINEPHRQIGALELRMGCLGADVPE